MEKEFIPYEQALALKELGFDEPCFTYFGNISQALFGLKGKIKFYTNTLLDIDHGKNVVSSASTFSQAFRWFKEKYKLMSCITPCSDGEYIFTLYDLNKCDLEVFVEDIEIMESEDSYEFFEDAELEGLKKLIEIIKTK